MPYISEDGLKFLRNIVDGAGDKSTALARMALIETAERMFCCPVCGGPLEPVDWSDNPEQIYFACESRPIDECGDFELHLMRDSRYAQGLVRNDSTREAIWPELRPTKEDRRDYYETERLEERRAA